MTETAAPRTAAPPAAPPAAPLVSVVLPTARGGAYLREAVASVVAQTEPRWELVVVADGLDENLSDLGGGDPRVRVLRQKQSGVSVARNRAIAAARGPVIALLDDDDVMLPGRLEAQLRHLEEHADIVLVHGQVDVVDGQGDLLGHGTLHAVQYADLLRGDADIVTSTVALRRSVLEEVGGFDPLLRAGEDLELYLRVARRGRLAFLPETLAQYRRHGSNQHSRPRDFQADVESIFGRHLHAALRDHDEEAARAAREGIHRFADRAASQLVNDARTRPFFPRLAAAVEAARLSPGAVATRLGQSAWHRTVPGVLRGGGRPGPQADAQPVTATVLETAAVTPVDVERWLDLVAHAVDPSPYFSPEHLTAIVDHTGEPVVPRVLVARTADGTWAGLIALWDAPHDDVWPAEHPTTGWFHVSTPLLRRGLEDAASAAILRAAVGTGGVGPVLDLPYLLEDAGSTSHLTQAAARLGLGLRVRPQWDAPWSPTLEPLDDPFAPLSQDRRRKLRKARRTVADLIGADVVLRDVSDDPDAVDQYLAAERTGWKSDGERGGYGLTPRPEWFRTMWTGLRRRDAIRMLAITGPSGAAYMGMLMVEDGTAYGFLDTFDEELRPHGIGNIGRVLTAGYCAGDPAITAYDPLLDPERYGPTAALFTSRRQWVGVTVTRPGWPSALLPRLGSARLQSGFDAARAARLWLRQVRWAARQALRPGSRRVRAS
ncbi:MAG: GNAT family N-acetyltransferase [Promicromonosporaceae bacterium]|nr:GNAT family N-acetyltransferase [Promicromonosporaceae bacterium]